MKIVKSGILLTSLLLLMFGATKTLQSKTISVQLNESQVQLSPLSDDETNPIKNQLYELSDFEIEDYSENNSTFNSIKIIPFLGVLLAFISFAVVNSSVLLFSLKRLTSFSFHKSPQSFLQVFRI